MDVAATLTAIWQALANLWTDDIVDSTRRGPNRQANADRGPTNAGRLRTRLSGGAYVPADRISR